MKHSDGLNERQIVLALRDQLHSRYQWITAHRKPRTSTRLCKGLGEELGYVPILQPEIDLAFGNDNIACAIEVKAFRSQQLTFALPFYEGLGQALALHRYGFDHVALWFIFHGPQLTTQIHEYGRSAWRFLRDGLKLPLDFAFFFVDSTCGATTFTIMQYIPDRDDRELLPFEQQRVLNFRYDNPIRHSPEAVAIRERILPWLKDPRAV